MNTLHIQPTTSAAVTYTLPAGGFINPNDPTGPTSSTIFLQGGAINLINLGTPEYKWSVGDHTNTGPSNNVNYPQNHSLMPVHIQCTLCNVGSIPLTLNNTVIHPRQIVIAHWVTPSSTASYSGIGQPPVGEVLTGKWIFTTTPNLFNEIHYFIEGQQPLGYEICDGRSINTNSRWTSIGQEFYASPGDAYDYANNSSNLRLPNLYDINTALYTRLYTKHTIQSTCTSLELTQSTQQLYIAHPIKDSNDVVLEPSAIFGYLNTMDPMAGPNIGTTYFTHDSGTTIVPLVNVSLMYAPPDINVNSPQNILIGVDRTPTLDIVYKFNKTNLSGIATMGTFPSGTITCIYQIPTNSATHAGDYLIGTTTGVIHKLSTNSSIEASTGGSVIFDTFAVDSPVTQIAQRFINNESPANPHYNYMYVTQLLQAWEGNIMGSTTAGVSIGKVLLPAISTGSQAGNYVILSETNPYDPPSDLFHMTYDKFSVQIVDTKNYPTKNTVLFICDDYNWKYGVPKYCQQIPNTHQHAGDLMFITDLVSPDATNSFLRSISAMTGSHIQQYRITIHDNTNELDGIGTFSLPILMNELQSSGPVLFVGGHNNPSGFYTLPGRSMIQPVSTYLTAWNIPALVAQPYIRIA